MADVKNPLEPLITDELEQQRGRGAAAPGAPAGGGRGAATPPPDPATVELVRRYQWPARPTLLGTSIKRLDGPDKVSGRAKYAYDISRPGMIYGKILRSPIPHGRIVSIDTSAAERAPGFKAVVLRKNPGQEVMYQGDPVLAIAADTEEHATDARRLIKVQYEAMPHFSSIDQAMAPNAPAVFMGGNTRDAGLQETGDIEAGFRQAAHVVEATYNTHVITHTCMETHGSVAEWDGDKLTAWVSTQATHGVRMQLAEALNIPQTDVRVINQFMGGGFGSKSQAGAEGVLCAQLAKAARVPVKLMLDRKEEHLDTGNRPSARAHVRAGVDANGMITAYDAQSWGTGGAGAGANFPLPYIYQFPNRRRAHKDVFINTGQQRPMRAPGHPQGSYLTEILMDELADAVNMDPVAFRIKNCPPDAPNARWAAYLAEGVKLFGWDKRHPTGDNTGGIMRTGMGCASNQWGGGGRGSQARCEIMSDGSVVMKIGTQDIGTGARTVVAIVTAETLGLPVSAVKPEIGDTIYPFSGGSSGSTTTASISPAIRLAAGKALDALSEKVAASLGVDKATLVAVNGRIQVRDNPSRGMTWANACRLIGTEPIAVDAAWADGLSSTGTSGVQFAEVSVDVETGMVKVTRVLAIQDCGLVVDKLTAESQVIGGVTGSLNFALYEDRILDRVTGQMVNPNMEWYLLAGMSDIPKIDVVLKNMPERGMIGVGEPPTVSTAAAIGNAVRNAIGISVRDLPLQPYQILNAMAQQRAGGTE